MAGLVLIDSIVLYFAIRLSWLGVILCHSYTVLY
jgi:hypothetical protein